MLSECVNKPVHIHIVDDTVLIEICSETGCPELGGKCSDAKTILDKIVVQIHVAGITKSIRVTTQLRMSGRVDDKQAIRRVRATGVVVADEEHPCDTRRWARQINDADRIGQAIGDPEFSILSRRYSHRLESQAERNNGDQTAKAQVEYLETIVGRVNGKQTNSIRRQRQRVKLITFDSDERLCREPTRKQEKLAP